MITSNKKCNINCDYVCVGCLPFLPLAVAEKGANHISVCISSPHLEPKLV